MGRFEAATRISIVPSADASRSDLAASEKEVARWSARLGMAIHNRFTPTGFVAVSISSLASVPPSRDQVTLLVIPGSTVSPALLPGTTQRSHVAVTLRPS